MPRQRKKKTDRQTVDAGTMELGIRKVVDDEWSIQAAAESLGINRTTLHRYVKKYKETAPEERRCMRLTPNYATKVVFSPIIEESLKEYLMTASQMHHGLTRKQVMQLAYQLAVANKLDCPRNWQEKQSAGVDWYYGFMKRHSELSLRKPEGTSLARSTSFNRTSVNAFFDNLESAYKQLGAELSPAAIYNLDETALSTVHNPPNVIAPKGQKQVGQVTSGERGTLVTACGIISANGNSIPPYMVFPRVHFKQHMLKGAPSGSSGGASKSGWMNGQLFVEVLEHFQKYARASIKKKVLLILDNHESHVTITSLDFCKQNGIILLTLPPHTSNKLQPLDRTVYKSLKSAFNAACNEWMINNPGKMISIYEVAELFGIAYSSAFTPANIKKGFESTGIWKLNRNVFKDSDFLCSSVTDRPDPTVADTASENTGLSSNRNIDPNLNVIELPNDVIVLNTSMEPIDLNLPTMSLDVSDVLVPNPEVPMPCEVRPGAIDSVKTGNKKNLVLPQDIQPFPKAAPRKSVNRKRVRSAILTDSPVKNSLCEEINARVIKKELIEENKRKRSAALAPKSKTKPKTASKRKTTRKTAAKQQ
ncbi:tigger transposable element-derived protein 6-like [Temnothorax longispinosus]|uniref:tigger transposable element-derived protein 6-like n=1 Tax=Temnothorax longispinosus TaxID=300112 RepID=UPI003A9A50F1